MIDYNMQKSMYVERDKKSLMEEIVNEYMYLPLCTIFASVCDFV